MGKQKEAKICLKNRILSGIAAHAYLRKPKRSIAVGVVIVLLVSLTVFGILSVVNTSADPANPDKNLMRTLFEMLGGLITAAAASVMCFQLFYMAEQERMDISNSIYQIDRIVRNNRKKAEEELKKFINEVYESKNDSVSGLDILFQGDYQILRDYSYQYEYLGYLVLRRKSNFGLIFDTVAFPDMLAKWLVPESEDRKNRIVRDKCRRNTPDFWNGCEFLYLTYEMKRAQNAFIIETDKKKREEKKNTFIEKRYTWYQFYKSIPK